MTRSQTVPSLPKGASLFTVKPATGEWFYVNHADTWQTMPNPIREPTRHRQPCSECREVAARECLRIADVIGALPGSSIHSALSEAAAAIRNLSPKAAE